MEKYEQDVQKAARCAGSTRWRMDSQSVCSETVDTVSRSCLLKEGPTLLQGSPYSGPFDFSSFPFRDDDDDDDDDDDSNSSTTSTSGHQNAKLPQEITFCLDAEDEHSDKEKIVSVQLEVEENASSARTIINLLESSEDESRTVSAKKTVVAHTRRRRRRSRATQKNYTRDAGVIDLCSGLEGNTVVPINRVAIRTPSRGRLPRSNTAASNEVIVID
eukprot:CAMPEP_0197239312 /NCGR_PEP_ID=MMETSP1429-20130617/5809_1 /TAXON_ID=49237 /ORGANISM="Chaetoceros  sp., Strain UNC1202" /LENGTH=216 /DNA_ID=CAMNT_0042698713 /DNA_START=71 /DNA_END=718 /DNA_ORIENTATION=+